MTQDHSPDHPAPPDYQSRGTDRRRKNLLMPPPFHTADGLILLERRSPTDRRASWIKDYTFAESGGEAG